MCDSRVIHFLCSSLDWNDFKQETKPWIDAWGNDHVADFAMGPRGPQLPGFHSFLIFQMKRVNYTKTEADHLMYAQLCEDDRADWDKRTNPMLDTNFDPAIGPDLAKFYEHCTPELIPLPFGEEPDCTSSVLRLST